MDDAERAVYFSEGPLPLGIRVSSRGSGEEEECYDYGVVPLMVPRLARVISRFCLFGWFDRLIGVGGRSLGGALSSKL